jgi:hypothetical protein
MINKFLENFHQPCEEHGVHGKVKIDRLVHDLCVANLNNRIQEQIVVKGRGTLRHDLYSIVVLLVSHIEVNSRSPETSTFASTHNLGNIEFAEEYLAVLHDLFWDVLGVKDAQFRKDSNVAIFQTKTLLKE